VSIEPPTSGGSMWARLSFKRSRDRFSLKIGLSVREIGQRMGAFLETSLKLMRNSDDKAY
jgi:hypothetical protein